MKELKPKSYLQYTKLVKIYIGLLYTEWELAYTEPIKWPTQTHLLVHHVGGALQKEYCLTQVGVGNIYCTKCPLTSPHYAEGPLQKIRAQIENLHVTCWIIFFKINYIILYIAISIILTIIIANRVERITIKELKSKIYLQCTNLLKSMLGYTL